MKDDLRSRIYMAKQLDGLGFDVLAVFDLTEDDLSQDISEQEKEQ